MNCFVLLRMECRASHRQGQGCTKSYITGPASTTFKKLLATSLSNCEAVLNCFIEKNSTGGSGKGFNGTSLLNIIANLSSVRAAVSIGNPASSPTDGLQWSNSVASLPEHSNGNKSLIL